MLAETLPRYCVGPSAYGAPKLPPPGGGKFSTAVAKSDIDWMVYVCWRPRALHENSLLSCLI